MHRTHFNTFEIIILCYSWAYDQYSKSWGSEYHHWLVFSRRNAHERGSTGEPRDLETKAFDFKIVLRLLRGTGFEICLFLMFSLGLYYIHISTRTPVYIYTCVDVYFKRIYRYTWYQQWVTKIHSIEAVVDFNGESPAALSSLPPLCHLLDLIVLFCFCASKEMVLDL